MVELAASPSCLWRNRVVAERSRVPPRSRHLRASSLRNPCSVLGGIGRLSVTKPCGSGVGDSVRWCCLGSLADLDGAVAPDLVSVSDQLLLTFSIFLTYAAGVIPRGRFGSVSSPKKEAVDDNVVDETPPSGSAWVSSVCSSTRNDGQAWKQVQAKLLDSLDALEQRSAVLNRVLDSDQADKKKRPLSLYAISEGPKLRLLWASFQQLERDVNNALGNNNAIGVDDWLKKFPEVVRKSSDPVCISWLAEELCLKDNKSKDELVSWASKKLKEDDTILRNMQKSGKEDLYIELLYFLKFGSLRMNSSFDSDLFISHGDSILEDMVINFADGIASLYLELISVDGNFSNEAINLGMILCSLSTRALQRLRNEVALSQWFYQNLESIVSMYEDRFDLYTLKSNILEDPDQSQRENAMWWNRLTFGKPKGLSSSLYHVTVCLVSVPVKRTKELRALTGWRYYYSLYLELLDISMPLIKAIIAKISDGISFFLVSLIGRRKLVSGLKLAAPSFNRLASFADVFSLNSRRLVFMYDGSSLGNKKTQGHSLHLKARCYSEISYCELSGCIYANVGLLHLQKM